MPRRVVLPWIVLMMLTTWISAHPEGNDLDGHATDRIIVKFAPSVAAGVVGGNVGSPDDHGLSAALRAKFGQWRVTRIRPIYASRFRAPESSRRHGLDRTYILEVPSGTDTQALVHALSGFEDEIEYAETDGIGGVAGMLADDPGNAAAYDGQENSIAGLWSVTGVATSSGSLIPNDPDFPRQYGLHNIGQTGGTSDADIDAPEGWKIHTGDPDLVTIAIVDTGVDPHPEFQARMIAGTNTADPDNEDLTLDGCPHGTHVTGIVSAAGDNGIGIAGVLWTARIMPVRVFTGCLGFESDVATGIIWAVDHGADICCVGLVFCQGTQALEDAVDYAHDNGVLVISATGFLGSCSGQVAFPARFENSMAVGATTDEDLLATFSNTGNELDVSAPGDRIWSTWPGNSYRLLNGTSMPTAFVSGLAGLTKSYYPSITHVHIRDILIATADDLGAPGRDDQFGYGRINAFNALTLLTGAFGACCETTPDLGGICTNGVPEDDCSGSQQHWNQRATCAQIDCDEARGACCDMDAGPLATEGDCTTDVLRSDCQCDRCVWTKGARCSDVPCPAIFVAIPTVSEWSLVILTLLLLTGAKIFFGRRAHEEWR